MRKLIAILLIFAASITSVSVFASEKEGLVYTDSDYERLHAVIEHVDNVLKYGHGFNPNTNLLPDAVNTLTGEPAKWTFPNRAKVPYSDLANQQNFLRTLVALSKVTNNSKYHNEAKATVGEFMENYQDRNGLMYWGGHRIINMETLEVQSTEGENGPHELKNMLPYYELMMEVNEAATIRFMEQLWTAHFRWQTADMNRHGSFSTAYDPNVFGQPMIDDVIKLDPETNLPIIPADSPGDLPFVNAATDLAYAAFTLSNHRGDSEPANWARYLMKQYELASNPETNMTVYQYKSTRVSKSEAECLDPSYTNSGCGDRVARQFRDFGPIARESSVQWKNTQAVYVDNVLMMLEVAEKFGEDDFIARSRKYLEGYLDMAYIRVDGRNKIIPMFNDGTVTYGYVTPEPGYYGPSNMRIDYTDLPSTFLLPILRTVLMTKDEADQVKLWTYFREIVHTFGLGDVGELGGKNPSLELESSIDDPFALMTMIELYDATGNRDYIDLARTIGNNLVRKKFHRGFFVENEIMLYSRLDQPDTLALLILDGVIRGIKTSDMPYYLADSGYIHGYMLANDGVSETRDYSHKYIYTRTIYELED